MNADREPDPKQNQLSDLNSIWPWAPIYRVISRDAPIGSDDEGQTDFRL